MSDQFKKNNNNVLEGHLKLEECDPKDVALKSFFLGPQAENSDFLLHIISDILQEWIEWRRSLFPNDGKGISEKDKKLSDFVATQERFHEMAHEIINRYKDELPKFSPRYIGHMLSEISMPALVGHIITLLHNPNIVTGEAGPVGVQIEREAIDFLIEMVGLNPEKAMGHFTSGGTVANFEGMIRARERMALWLAAGAVAREEKKSQVTLFESAHMGWQNFDKFCIPEKIKPWIWIDNNPWHVSLNLATIFGEVFRGPIILVPENKHYSWKKGATLLGLGDEAFWPLKLDSTGRCSIKGLEDRLREAEAQSRPIMMVVSMAGTTEMGDIDPIAEVQDVLDRWAQEKGIHIWHHVDAAYGGFFCSLERLASELLLPTAVRDLNAIRRANSVTLDPHKLGYVPYSCGAFLSRERREYYLRTYDSPYLQFEGKTDRGAYTIEGSRSAAGATATWLTAKCIGLNDNGYGRIIARSIRNTQRLRELLSKTHLMIRPTPRTESNVLCFTVAKEGEKLSDTNSRVMKIYEKFSRKGQQKFFVSKTTLNWNAYGEYLEQYTKSWKAQKDVNELTLIRLCLMNPFVDSKEMSINLSEEFCSEIKKTIESL